MKAEEPTNVLQFVTSTEIMKSNAANSLEKRTCWQKFVGQFLAERFFQGSAEEKKLMQGYECFYKLFFLLLFLFTLFNDVLYPYLDDQPTILTNLVFSGILMFFSGFYWFCANVRESVYRYMSLIFLFVQTLLSLNFYQSMLCPVCDNMDRIEFLMTYTMRTLLIALGIQNWLPRTIILVQFLMLPIFATKPTKETDGMHLLIHLGQIIFLSVAFILLLHRVGKELRNILHKIQNKDALQECLNVMMNLHDAIVIIDCNHNILLKNLTFDSLASKLQLPISSTGSNFSLQGSSASQDGASLPPSLLAWKLKEISFKERLTNTTSQNLAPSVKLKEVIADIISHHQAEPKTDEPFKEFEATMPSEQADGTDNTMLIKIKAVNSIFGKEGVIILISDVTGLSENIKLKDQDHFKSKLMASVSHELRTPLNSIINYLTVLQADDKINKEVQKDVIGPAITSAKSQLHIVNDIIDYAQLELGTLIVEKKQFNLRNKLTEIVNIVKGSLTENSSSDPITLNVDPTVPETIVSDANRLAQMLINILQMATKKTMSDNLSFHVSTRRRDTNDQLYILFEIRDNSMKNLSFSKAEDLEVQSSWLGLATTKGLLKKMGSITGLKEAGADMSPGNTLIFWFDLPCGVSQKSTQATPPQTSVEPESPILPSNDEMILFCDEESPDKLRDEVSPLPLENQNHKAKKQYNALIVDDNKFNLLSLAQVLKIHGITSLPANSGQEALAIFKKHLKGDLDIGIDFVTMDLQMPDMDGFETFANLTALAKDHNKGMPFVYAHSAHIDDKTKKECLEIGMRGILSKPLQLEELRQIISVN